MVDLANYLLPKSSSVRSIVILFLVVSVLFLSIKDLARGQASHIDLKSTRQSVQSNELLTTQIPTTLLPTTQPSTINCTKLETFTKLRNYPYVALSSYYGSGNTWMRHLLQLYSGISTSTLYNDGEINTNSDLSREAEQIKNSVCENEPDISNFMGYGSYTYILDFILFEARKSI